jgi:hypothetical protein
MPRRPIRAAAPPGPPFAGKSPQEVSAMAIVLEVASVVLSAAGFGLTLAGFIIVYGRRQRR